MQYQIKYILAVLSVQTLLLKYSKEITITIIVIYVVIWYIHT